MDKKRLNFELPAPTRRECKLCGEEYIGTRIICDSDSCWNEYQYQRESKKFKLGPSINPAGMLFYKASLDELKDEDPIE